MEVAQVAFIYSINIGTEATKQTTDHLCTKLSHGRRVLVENDEEPEAEGEEGDKSGGGDKSRRGRRHQQQQQQREGTEQRDCVSIVCRRVASEYRQAATVCMSRCNAKLYVVIVAWSWGLVDGERQYRRSASYY